MAVEELRKLSFNFPRLPKDSPASCPCSAEDVAEYAALEMDEVEEPRFVRTFDVEDVHYWVWEIGEGRDHAFVYVEVYEDTILTGSQLSRGMTVEQFLVREFLHNQYGRQYV